TLAVANFPVALENLQKVVEIEKSGKKKYTQEIETQHFPMMKMGALSIAQALSQQKKYKEAAVYFNAAYKVDPKDQANLYNAAAMAVNGQDYDKALEYYLELDKIGFTGAGTNFYATNKETKQAETFPNKDTRDQAVKLGQYVNPKDEKTPSLKGDIVKNIALIYAQKGDVEKAKAAMSNARKANPNDVSLIINEADLYLKTNDTETYKRLITEAIAKNPKDADMFYNLGVVTSAANPDEAIKHYQKALEINPKYVNANINVGVLMLAGEQKIVDEMNGLGTSAKDNKRYDELKTKRDGLYKKAMPYFEKAYAVEPDNEYVLSLLASVYQALEMDAKYKEVKAKLKS
ncbi:MAG: tetratricopeptide repeat protein, partial [Chitinophagaceae bacterium]